MTIELFVIISLFILIGLYFVVPFVVGTFLRYRGQRLITCPETRQPAAIKVDAAHAALTAAAKLPELRLKSCSRWPEREDCGQECLLQVELSPEDCLVRNILANWYDGKYCVSCGKKIGEIHWLECKPALLSPEGKTIDWEQLPAEQLPGVLSTHFPVCGACHITETFCREYPELIVDRSRISAEIHRSRSA
jgi:hypothetical protein